jgi:hypothetical protein
MFEIIGDITKIQVIASGRGIRRFEDYPEATRRQALAGN